MLEVLKTDLTRWVIGPYHPLLPGAMRLHLDLDGEVITEAQVETGYTHRGLEKALEFQAWRALLPYMDRLDPESAVFGELVLCLAVEQLGGITPPPRARAIRVVLSELSRIASHLLYAQRVAKCVGADTAASYIGRDREKILDLFELLTGARFSLHFLRYGGVAADITEGFLERVLEVCELLRYRIKEYNDVFTFNRAFTERARGVAGLELVRCRALGISGPAARASGSGEDLRKQLPYSDYEKLDFDIPSGASGSSDVLDRFLMHFREIEQSMRILRQLSEHMPSGPFRDAQISASFQPPKGESFARVESPRGFLGCHLVSDGERAPARVQLRTPSSFLLGAIPELLRGARVEDASLILASLDLSLAEADR